MTLKCTLFKYHLTLNKTLLTAILYWIAATSPQIKDKYTNAVYLHRFDIGNLYLPVLCYRYYFQKCYLLKTRFKIIDTMYTDL